MRVTFCIIAFPIFRSKNCLFLSDIKSLVEMMLIKGSLNRVCCKKLTSSHIRMIKSDMNCNQVCVKSATGQGFKQTQWLNGKTQHLRNRTKCFTLLSLHLPLSRDSRNELQFCWLLKYSLLKQRGYYISEKNIYIQSNQQSKKKKREIVFHYISKHLQFRQKYSAARCFFNPLLGDRKFGETLPLVFDILHEKLH